MNGPRITIKGCPKRPMSVSRAWKVNDICHSEGDPRSAYHCKNCGQWHVGLDDKMVRAYAAGTEEATR